MNFSTRDSASTECISICIYTYGVWHDRSFCTQIDADYAGLGGWGQILEWIRDMGIGIPTGLLGRQNAGKGDGANVEYRARNVELRSGKPDGRWVGNSYQLVGDFG